MIYLLAHQLSNGSKALAVQKDGSLCGGEDLEQSKMLIPNWNNYHSIDKTWSTSATLFYISYHPCIISFNNLKEIEEQLLDKKVTEERNIWGGCRYTLLKPEYNWIIVFDPKLI